MKNDDIHLLQKLIKNIQDNKLILSSDVKKILEGLVVKQKTRKKKIVSQQKTRKNNVFQKSKTRKHRKKKSKTTTRKIKYNENI